MNQFDYLTNSPLILITLYLFYFLYLQLHVSFPFFLLKLQQHRDIFNKAQNCNAIYIVSMEPSFLSISEVRLRRETIVSLKLKHTNLSKDHDNGN